MPNANHDSVHGSQDGEHRRRVSISSCCRGNAQWLAVGAGIGAAMSSSTGQASWLVIGVVAGAIVPRIVHRLEERTRDAL